jgi:predicted MFS family arabinose efflux permease
MASASTPEIGAAAGRAAAPTLGWPAMTRVCLVFLLANAAFSAMPVLFGAYVDQRHFSLVMAGMVASAESTGLALGSTLSVRLLLSHEPNLRKIVLYDLALLVLAQLASAYAGTPWIFAASRALSGVCVGVVQSAGAAWIARFQDSDRLFAIYIGMTFLAGTLGMPVFSFTQRHVGLTGSYLVFAALVALAMVVSVAYPAISSGQTAEGADARDGGRRSANRRQRFLLPSVAINFAFNGGLWVYLEQAGQHANIEVTHVSVILSAGMLSALGVTVAIGLIGHRFGRWRPLVMAHICLLVGTLLLIGNPSIYGFCVAVVIFHIGLAIVSPYFLAELAAMEPSGRPALKGVAAMNIGYSVGPWLVSALVERFGYNAALVCSAGMFTVCLILVRTGLVSRSE